MQVPRLPRRGSPSSVGAGTGEIPAVARPLSPWYAPPASINVPRRGILPCAVGNIASPLKEYPLGEPGCLPLYAALIVAKGGRCGHRPDGIYGDRLAARLVRYYRLIPDVALLAGRGEGARSAPRSARSWAGRRPCPPIRRKRATIRALVGATPVAPARRARPPHDPRARGSDVLASVHGCGTLPRSARSWERRYSRGGARRPSPIARTAAWVRSETPSLAMIRST